MNCITYAVCLANAVATDFALDYLSDKYASILRYDSKSVRLMSEPFCRVDSPRCELWHKLAKNSSIFERDMEEVLCQPCKKMISHLDQRVRAANSVTPAEKVARLDPSSRCPLAVLSPNSRKKRKENLLRNDISTRRNMNR
jgi:oligoribonuclease (3'-5' exoribonuclease)